MKKIVIATFLVSFTAGLVTGWFLLPQPMWMFDTFGHFMLFK